MGIKCVKKNQINSIIKGGFKKMERSATQVVKQGGICQSAIKKEWDYKYLILSSMWPAAPRQEGGGRF